MTTTPIEAAAEAVARGDVVAFTGAGVSAESGIPTFRDPGGLWDRYDPMRFATFEGVAREAMEHPDELAGYLTEMRAAFASARPNAAHLALAHLEREGLLIGVITQNVDGLHGEAGNTDVVEVHGSHARRRCLSCGALEDVSRQEYVAGLDRTIQALRTAFVPSYQSLLPRCRACGGPARPDVVAFGETVRDFHRAERLAERARTLLVVGTSGEVYPAAALPEHARGCGATIVEVAKGPTSIRADVMLEGAAGAILPRLVDLAVRALHPG
ncbi:MAG: NAD-dependent deacetylase [Actinomycetota bacterium]